MARVVIIEDHEDLVEAYRLALEKAGHTVCGSHVDPLAVLTAPADGTPVDLVLLDERLGPESGTAYLPQIRRRFQGAMVMVVSADIRAADRAVALGADGARAKPLTMDELNAAVRELLAGPSTARAAAGRRPRASPLGR
ncbi:MAG TPA: response regulator [Myxococcota bacterium]|jgi:DNA-binding response OmpR family regulator|nr:response regulator [Myxococcota bacterium]